jgi:hypothetical protein
MATRSLIDLHKEIVEIERRRFEDWWQSRGMFKPSRRTEPGYTHEYEMEIAENAWKAWLARAEVG